MKPVVHVITTICRGGAENQLVTLVSQQIKSGRDVTVIYLKDTPELLSSLTTLGAKVSDILIGKNPIQQIQILRNFLNSKDVIVHAHLPRAELISAFAVKNHILILSKHNSEQFFPGAPKIISQLLAQTVSKKSSYCIAISNAVARYLKENKEISSKIPLEVVHYGFANSVETEKPKPFDTSELANFTKKIFTVGTIARITSQKDYPTLLKAFSKFNETYPESQLLIIGDGELLNSSKELAARLGISKKVIWAGRTENIYGALNLMDIFVLTSNYEGFGLVLLEAMQANLPILASNNSAIPEVLGERSDSLFETGDWKDLAKKLSLVTNIENRFTLIKESQKRLLFFNPVKMRENMDRAYNKASLMVK